MKFWGLFESGAAARLTTADFWAHLRSGAAAAGEDLSGVGIQAVNRLRSYATQIRNTTAPVGDLAVSGTIDASQIAEAPWSRSAAEMAFAPAYQVRFQVDVVTPQGTSRDWKSLFVPIGLPATGDELVSQLQDYAQGLADKYQASFGGLGNVQILRV